MTKRCGRDWKNEMLAKSMYEDEREQPRARVAVSRCGSAVAENAVIEWSVV